MEPISQRPKPEIPGLIAQDARRRRRLFERFAGERRFWPLFRLWLLPVGALTFLVFFAGGVSAWTGADTLIVDGAPVHGWRGFLVTIEMVPVFTLCITIAVAGGIWLDHKLKALFQAGKRLVIGEKRKR
jgi:hypothetical protein